MSHARNVGNEKQAGNIEKNKRHSPQVIVHATPVRVELISERAFQLFEQRGCVHGFDVEDWLKAEEQIAAECLN